MITKQEFESAAAHIRSNFGAALPKMISFKSQIQRVVLMVATPQEIEDVRASRINQSLIDKLAGLAKTAWTFTPDAQSLYCAAMAVATIVKEYDWGVEYLVGDGLWTMADRIQNAKELK